MGEEADRYRNARGGGTSTPRAGRCRTTKPLQDHHRHLPSGSQRGDQPESPSERICKREANKAKGAAGKSYEPDRPSGKRDNEIQRKQSWSNIRKSN